MYDLCIIGGGAAGLACAISAGRLGLKVLLIDKNKKQGKKLYATGNGRCNLSNNYFDEALHFNSSNPDYAEFIKSGLCQAYDNTSPNSQIINFMDSIGINTIDYNNYIYPSSAQASSVVWAMLDETKSYNVEIRSNIEIINVTGKYPNFTIKSQNESFKASQVVLACGGMTYKSLGGTLSGYQLAKFLGHSVKKLRPSLCGLKVSEDLSEIAGVRAQAKISLRDETNKLIKSSYGELQITNQGLSGICIFELASKVGSLLEQNTIPKISISLLDLTDSSDVSKRLKEKIISNSLGDRTIIGMLNGYINDKLALYICKKNNIDGKLQARNIDTNILFNIVNELNNLDFNITSLYDTEQAQVTAGGVDISQINSKTFESKLLEGLYIVGELLDIDGICGGYNLTFAMLSGIKAGKSVYDKNKSNKGSYRT